MAEDDTLTSTARDDAGSDYSGGSGEFLHRFVSERGRESAHAIALVRVGMSLCVLGYQGGVGVGVGFGFVGGC